MDTYISCHLGYQPVYFKVQKGEFNYWISIYDKNELEELFHLHGSQDQLEMLANTITTFFLIPKLFSTLNWILFFKKSTHEPKENAYY